jgi:hypothetical protein
MQFLHFYSNCIKENLLKIHIRDKWFIEKLINNKHFFDGKI